MEKYATWLKEVNKIAFQNSVDYILRLLLLYSTMYQIILTQIPLHSSDILEFDFLRFFDQTRFEFQIPRDWKN